MTPIKTVPLAFLATALAIGVALYFNIFTAKPAALEPYPIAFENVSKDVYRQGFLWRVPGVPASGMLHRLVDVHVFLIKIGQDNVLVDVGAPGEEYKRILSAGLRESLKGGQLRLVICELLLLLLLLLPASAPCPMLASDDCIGVLVAAKHLGLTTVISARHRLQLG